jgi:hypothetical protein
LGREQHCVFQIGGLYAEGSENHGEAQKLGKNIEIVFGTQRA